MLKNRRISKSHSIYYQEKIQDTGTPPLTRFFGPGKNRVKGKPRYRRSILVLKPQNGEYETSKSTFLQNFLNVFRPLRRVDLLDPPFLKDFIPHYSLRNKRNNEG